MSKDFYNYKQGDNTKQKSFVIPTQNIPISKLINSRDIAKYEILWRLLWRKDNSSVPLSIIVLWQLCLTAVLSKISSSGILTWFPFVICKGFPDNLGPTHPCMFANFKETFSTTAFKASKAFLKKKHCASFEWLLLLPRSALNKAPFLHTIETSQPCIRPPTHHNSITN